jgi:4-hydroxy-3-methylbut-2-enyl diphosphate reductase
VAVERVLLADPRGFCAGVEMAIKALTWMVRVFPPPVYCYHEIVHNAAVVGMFERAGVVFVDDIAAVPPGAPLRLSAHGSAPEVTAAAESAGAVTVDAVCPLVTKVHHEVRRRAADGYDIIYVGHHGHDEAAGTVAVAPGAVTLVEPESGLEGFAPRDPGRVALLAQTTLGLFEWEAVLDSARDRFPDLWTARRSDLCYATTNRQEAVTRMAQQVDLVLVIGAQNSSNCNRLREVAETLGVPAHLINGPEEIRAEWLEGKAKVGITSGASTPEVLVESVIQALSPERVTLLQGAEEDVSFSLPRELR